MTATRLTGDQMEDQPKMLSSGMTASIGAIMLLSTLFLAGFSSGKAQATQQCASPCADNTLSVGYLA